MIASWANHFHQVTLGYDKNCWFFTNGQFLNMSCFSLLRPSLLHFYTQFSRGWLGSFWFLNVVVSATCSITPSSLKEKPLEHAIVQICSRVEVPFGDHSESELFMKSQLGKHNNEFQLGNHHRCNNPILFL